MLYYVSAASCYEDNTKCHNETITSTSKIYFTIICICQFQYGFFIKGIFENSTATWLVNFSQKEYVTMYTILVLPMKEYTSCK